MLKGSIRQRGEKYQVIYPYKDEEGNWKQKSKTCDTITQAKAHLKKLNFEVDDVINDNPRLSVIAGSWIREISLHGSENTVKAYEANSLFVITRLGDKKVKDVTRQDVVKLYQDIKKEGYETNAYRGCFNMIMNFAIKSKYITMNPGKGITVTRTKEKRSAKLFSQTERMRLLDNVEGTRYYYLVYLLLKTGLRMGEMLGLSWKAIDLEEGTLTVRQQLLISNEITTRLKSKNSKRTLYLDSETIGILKQLKSSPFSTFDLIFDEPDGIRSGILRFLGKFDATPHDLRHNHGTDLLDICNIADAANRMGHTIEEYVSTYAHPSDASQREIAIKLNSSSYRLCDRFVTEGVGKVVNMARTNVSNVRED